MRPDRSASANKRVASKIAPRLYLTCLATAKDVAQLADLGITHVVSVIEDAPKFPSTYPLHTLHISVSDYDGEDILSHLPTTTSFIRGALAESPKNRVLVHCFMGISRSTTVVIAYLIATTKMTPHEALTSVRSKRTIVRPNRGFMSQLQEYYSKCSDSLQAELGCDEPPDTSKDGEPGKNVKKARRGHAALTAKAAAAKNYARYALTAVTSLPPHISLYSPEGREYWKFEDRLF
ncbi:protein-tyrosine phosphatase-like protein [Russula ochroleuca]|jgi:protein-tyrosine phosphatase|uniref:protein-tyrosine-phosphatase n=1 Tax=Russula ochroleuca TaxID=152965 RepID=A0A9P5MV75_9AGAM|nr:protein-tyrosine phosphatase-like protein [Russula ochroleuca]